MAELRNEFLKNKHGPGLTDKSIDIALWLYQNRREKMPPRLLANPDKGKLKMPIPFDNMAAKTPTRNNMKMTSAAEIEVKDKEMLLSSMQHP